MSILTAVDTDHSSAMAKRFASLTANYLAQPSSVDIRVLQVPLENLYRLSEMFRYDAFADEPRKGVLAIDTAAPDKVSVFEAEERWSVGIEGALSSAFTSVFGGRTDANINELQDALRVVASKEEAELAAEDRTRLQDFLRVFQENLA